MEPALSEDDLRLIEGRLRDALEIVSPPWAGHRETGEPIGGESFIAGGRPSFDEEIYLHVVLGTEQLGSPDPRLDALIDFLAHAPADIATLVAAVRRLQDA